MIVVLVVIMRSAIGCFGNLGLNLVDVTTHKLTRSFQAKRLCQLWERRGEKREFAPTGPQESQHYGCVFPPPGFQRGDFIRREFESSSDAIFPRCDGARVFHNLILWSGHSARRHVCISRFVFMPSEKWDCSLGIDTESRRAKVRG